MRKGVMVVPMKSRRDGAPFGDYIGLIPVVDY